MQKIVITTNKPASAKAALLSFGSTENGMQYGGPRPDLRIKTPKLSEPPSLDEYMALVRTIVGKALDNDCRELFVLQSQLERIGFENSNLTEYELGRHFAENVYLRAYAFTKFKTLKPGESHDFAINVLETSQDFARGVKDGSIVGEYLCLMRTLANTPPNILGPEEFVNRIREATKSLGQNVNVTVLTDTDIKQQGLNLLYAVGQGSKQGARLVVLEYSPEPHEHPFDVLVGKGITFDTGGMNLKPSDSLTGMEKDMSGAAAVLAAFCAAVKLEVPRNILAVLPIAENAFGSNAFITTATVQSLAGPSVTIGNTDAEGRLVLADAITYAAKHYVVNRMMTVATLTGACHIALGDHACGIFTEDEEREYALRKNGDLAGDYVWPLPPWSCYDEGITNDPVSDLNNVQKGRYGGATIGFRFLAQFANHDKVPKFAHLDMAPRMEAIKSDNIGDGASGDPVRFLVRYLQDPDL